MTRKLSRSDMADPLHAMQFLASQEVQVRGGCPSYRPPRSDRDCPLDTAVDRCLWHASGTAGENGDAPTRWRRLPARPEGEAGPRRPVASLARARRARGSPNQGLEPQGQQRPTSVGLWNALALSAGRCEEADHGNVPTAERPDEAAGDQIVRGGKLLQGVGPRREEDLARCRHRPRSRSPPGPAAVRSSLVLPEIHSG